MEGCVNVVFNKLERSKSRCVDFFCNDVVVHIINTEGGHTLLSSLHSQTEDDEETTRTDGWMDGTLGDTTPVPKKPLYRGTPMVGFENDVKWV